MDPSTAWQNLANAISAVQGPGGDYDLKLATVKAGIELLFEHGAEEILPLIERSGLPTRAIVSWLVFEGSRIPTVDRAAVDALREFYEATCPPGQGIIPPPPPGSGVRLN